MRIKEILKEKGITQTDLANRMGIAQSTLSVLLKNPTHSTMQRIAYTLGVQITDLIDGNDKFSLDTAVAMLDENGLGDLYKLVDKVDEEKKKDMPEDFRHLLELQRLHNENKPTKQEFTIICPHCGKEIPLKIDTEALNNKG